MVNNKKFKIALIVFLSLFYLGLGLTSIGHIFRFWDISNNWIYHIILGVGNALGIISSILLLFFPKEYGVNVYGWIIFILTTLIEIVGNIYYNYAVTDPNSTNFILLHDFLKTIFDEYNLSIDFSAKLRAYNSIVVGLWLPLTHIAVFGALARIIETYNLNIEKDIIKVDEPELNNNEDSSVINNEQVNNDTVETSNSTVNEQVDIDEGSIKKNNEVFTSNDSINNPLVEDDITETETFIVNEQPQNETIVDSFETNNIEEADNEEKKNL